MTADVQAAQAGYVGATAKAVIGQVLGDYGLTSLTTWAWTQITSGATSAQVLLNMQQTTQFKQRFPGIVQRQKAGLPPISPADYISYETQMKQLEHQYGLPGGFLSTPDRIGNLIGQDVSASEVQARVQQGYAVVAYAPAEVRQAFTAMFGANGDGALAAHFLTTDAATPLLEQQATGAQFSGIASMGGAHMSTQDAMTLAQNGVSASQVQSGVSQLEQQRGLFNANVGEQPGLSEGKEGIESQFGLNATAEAAVTAREQTREAEFKGGGAPYTDQYGASGAGAARKE